MVDVPASHLSFFGGVYGDERSSLLPADPYYLQPKQPQF